jgi:hypothetical protein
MTSFDRSEMIDEARKLDDIERKDTRITELEAALAELERKYAVVRKTLSDIAYAFVVTEEAILIMKKMAREALEKGEL